MTEEIRFNWIAFYMELANKLIPFNDNRPLLVSKIKTIFEHVGLNLPKLEKGGIVYDVDPFTVFGLFNKGITTENRLKLSSFFRCIGQKKHGERLTMDWSKVIGSRGRAHFKPRTYTDRDGNERQTNGHTPQTLRNLANIMASHEDLLADALRLDRRRMDRYCRTVDPDFLRMLNQRKPRTMAALADVWYRGNGADYGRSQHYNDSRYHMLNLHATFTKGTIEFRLFQFDAPANGKQNGIHAGQLKSYIQLCLALSQMAKDVRTASPKPQQNENPKYAMRTWLLRLGFIGEEFATARDFLTRNLDGDAAFRKGRAAA